jgi:multiple sugar transport system permease protein
MTAGGPAGATEALPVLLYNTAFRANRFGEAAAIGVLLLVIVLVFAMAYVKIARLDRVERA